MKRLFSVAFSLLLVSPFAGAALTARALANALPAQTDKHNTQMNVARHGERHLRPEVGPRHHGKGHSFKKSGTSAGRGGSDFGKNISHGKPIKAGRHFGKGIGGFGKNLGKGVGKTSKHVAKP